MHLAPALCIGTADAVLATWDDDLARAAPAEGLSTAPR
jgi:hypothetical protein